MDSPSGKAEVLAAIRSALSAGTDVEELLEPAIRHLPDRADATVLGAKLRVLLQAEPAQGGSESIRRIADRLDRFAAELVATATVLEDEELTVISEQARARQFVPEPSVPRQLPRIARFGPKVHARIDRELVDRRELLIGEGRLFESADALGDLLPPAGADQRRGDHIVAKHP